MKPFSIETQIKVFNLSYQYLIHDLLEVQAKHNLHELIPDQTYKTEDSQYYPQFDDDIREESTLMGYYYQIFYCLERSMRKMIAQTIESSEGPNWWNSEHIPEPVIQNVESTRKKERDSGLSIRSDLPIDYTDFGELGEIIKKNWIIFGSIFNSQRAVEKVISTLNMLRNSIAHCSPLSEDEAIRLKLSVKDWFRLME